MIDAFIDIADILEQCERSITPNAATRLEEWRKLKGRENCVLSLRDLMDRIPGDGKMCIRTTTQADMNVSSGKNGIKRLAASKELDWAILDTYRDAEVYD